jgi:hypothetical protein
MRDDTLPASNQLLALLTPEDLALLQPHLVPMDLPLRESLARLHSTSLTRISSIPASPRW